MHRGWLLAEPRLAYFSALVSTCDARPKRAQHVFHHILACSRLWSDPAFYVHPPQCSCAFCITIPSLCPPAPLLAPPPQTQSNLHMRVPRRCSTPWRRSALPPTSSLARTLYWPHCLRHTLNVSNAYPLPAPSSHWGFHVADAARRGVTMCSALPPSLACTLYWRHVPLPPRVNLRVSVPCVSHFIPLACTLYFHPVYTAMAPSLLRPPAP
mgnify:CR=1 FL=1